MTPSSVVSEELSVRLCDTTYIAPYLAFYTHSQVCLCLYSSCTQYCIPNSFFFPPLPFGPPLLLSVPPFFFFSSFFFSSLFQSEQTRHTYSTVAAENLSSFACLLGPPRLLLALLSPPLSECVREKDPIYPHPFIHPSVLPWLPNQGEREREGERGRDLFTYFLPPPPPPCPWQ